MRGVADTDPGVGLRIHPTVDPRDGQPTTAPGANRTTRPPGGPLHLLILGDSIAIPEIGCGQCVGFDRRYADHIEQATGRHVDLANEARPGATISYLQGVLDAETGVKAEVAQADIVVVSIGYNDGPSFAPDEPCHAPEAVHDIDQLKAILAFTPECVDATLALRRTALDRVYARIAELGADRTQVRVTFGVFNNLNGNPGGDGTFADFPRSDLRKVTAIMKSLTDDWNAMNCATAATHGFVCADLYHAFNGADGTGSVGRYVAPDFTHPNREGQRIMANLLGHIDLAPLGLAG
jgi:hypothetical protein